MLNVAIENNVVELHSTEAQIIRMKELKHKMDVMEAEYNRIKKTLLEGHFKDNQEFVGSEGLVLATYKSQKRAQFVSSEFKKDHAELYNDYCVDTEIKVFLIKK